MVTKIRTITCQRRFGRFPTAKQGTTPYKNYSLSVYPIASTTILTALLIVTWFLLAILCLVLTLTLLYFKEAYKVEVILTCQPTTPTVNLTPEWPAGVQVMSPAELTPTPFTDLLSALLGFFLTTLLSILALALIVSHTLCLTLCHLE
ncbi:uncharacterized protein FIBRA_08473 [Fibroporia radiculosa]|uniref:Uncharacterized protein n=1 Tax=Fibroporia radiculosa TaxID=599839 RepID=J4I2T6_9APHY|nr:uncharacterized protein FIBRA_08473 [Fibroporia radiculosa]CCM06227.1 predicted protein [Fibroporia radiculosa]